MIQFPQGTSPPQPAVPESGRSALPAGRTADSSAALTHAPADSLALRDAAAAALDLDLLRDWDDGPARAAGASEYQSARTAAATGDRAATLPHLEQSMLAHPAYAEAAQQDPAFDAMRGDVRDMAARLTVLGRIRAETAMGEARVDLDSIRGSDAPGRVQHAQAYLDLAQAHFESGSYSGYLIATQAAVLAQQAANGLNVASPAATAPTAGKALLRPVTRAACHTVRRLWQTLPLLAILLGWFAAGVLAGIASLPFQQGAVAELRQTLFPIWAMGLLSMVLLGFVRSIRQIRRRRS